MKNDCKIFALVVVKNEDDIIYDVIESATQWAEKIFIMDNMSTDTTWEKLKKISDKYNNVILWGQYGGKFNEGLRQILFKEYRHFASENDWWCRLDGDEFYIDDPRSFIRKLPERIDHIYNASFQYYYTEQDYDRDLSKTPGNGYSDYESLRWYKCNHSEIRFVKNKQSICWLQYEGWPCNLLYPTTDRIRLKHFQYRSLEQIKNRAYLRSESVLGQVFKHEIVSDDMWYKRRGFKLPNNQVFIEYKIVQSTDLSNNDNYAYDDSELPVIINTSIKKYIKCSFIYIYMRLINRSLFKI